MAGTQSPLLPLPVAALCRRSRNAKSPKEQHDLAYYAFEVSLRLAVAFRAPSDLRGLLKGQLGEWARAYQPNRERTESPALLRTFSSLVEVAQQRQTERRVVACREWVDAWITYRNKMIGHGAPRSPSFYSEQAEVLRQGLIAAWDEEVFWPKDARLRFVDAVEVHEDGRRTARVLALEADLPSLMGEAVQVPEDVFGHRVYCEMGTSWTSLWPLVLFDEESESVVCLSAMRRHAEFLDYGSGMTLPSAELERIDPKVEPELRGVAESGTRSGSSGPRGAKSGEVPETQSQSENLRIVCELGRGANGTVHLAWQEQLERAVAVKRLTALGASDPVARSRFAREARALARLDHPNIVRVLGTHSNAGEPQLLLEFIPGIDLRDWLPELAQGRSPSEAARKLIHARWKQLRDALPQLTEQVEPTDASGSVKRELELVAFFLGAARGLAHAHERGIAHRDLSPGNLMVMLPGPRAVLTDFGLATFKGVESKLTRNDGAPLGTLLYVAPERLNPGSGDFEPTSDIYSLGALMYEAFAGHPPFVDTASSAALMRSIQFDDPPWLRVLKPDLSPEIEAVVHRAIAKRPSDRYATASLLAEDLERILRGELVQAQKVGVFYRTKKALRRKRALVLAISAVALAAAGGLGIGWMKRREAEQRELHAKLAELPLEQLLALRGELERQLTAKVASAPPPVDKDREQGRSATLRMDYERLDPKLKESLEQLFDSEPPFFDAPEKREALDRLLAELRQSDDYNRVIVALLREAGVACANEGELDAGRVMLEYVVDGLFALEGANSTETLESLTLLGWTAERLGDTQQARDIYKEALAGFQTNFPTLPALWRTLPLRISALEARAGDPGPLRAALETWISEWESEAPRPTDATAGLARDREFVRALVANLPDASQRDELAKMLPELEAGRNAIVTEVDSPPDETASVGLDESFQLSVDNGSPLSGGSRLAAIDTAYQLILEAQSLPAAEIEMARKLLTAAQDRLIGVVPDDHPLLAQLRAILAGSS